MSTNATNLLDSIKYSDSLISLSKSDFISFSSEIFTSLDVKVSLTLFSSSLVNLHFDRGVTLKVYHGSIHNTYQ